MKHMLITTEAGWCAFCLKTPLIKRFLKINIQPQHLASIQRRLEPSLRAKPVLRVKYFFQPQPGQCPCRKSAKADPHATAGLEQSSPPSHPSARGRHNTPAEFSSQLSSPPRRQQGSEWRKELCCVAQKNTRQDGRYPLGLFPGKAVSGRPGQSERSHLTCCDLLAYVTIFILNTPLWTHSQLSSSPRNAGAKTLELK